MTFSTSLVILYATSIKKGGKTDFNKIFLAGNKKFKLVRFGLLEHMHCAVRHISAQSLKQNEPDFVKYAQLDNLIKQVSYFRQRLLLYINRFN